MNCENLQFNLAIYLDDVLTDEERAIVEKHLVCCPLCRQKLADFQSARNDLRVLARPEMPPDLLFAVRSRVAQEIKPNRKQAVLRRRENFRQWLQMRFMPYSIGTAASLLLGFLLLWSLLSAAHNLEQNTDSAKYEPLTKSSVLFASANPKAVTDKFEFNGADLPSSRLYVSNESPSINPQGALVALTKSFARGKMKDDEVVVVADVFENGLARIAEVVEPSSDRRAVRELQQALKNNPDYAPPFVPARLDQRSDTVRVILKIQSVNVDTHLSSQKR